MIRIIDKLKINCKFPIKSLWNSFKQTYLFVGEMESSLLVGNGVSFRDEPHIVSVDLTDDSGPFDHD